MKNWFRQITLALIALPLLLAGCAPKQPTQSLKEAFGDMFVFGTALNEGQILGTDTVVLDLIHKHFNSITAENVMKSQYVQPQEGVFEWELSDKFVEFGEKHNMHIVGHTLIWHSQSPDWFFVDENGNDVSREVLIERMRNHIHTVVGRYKGRVHGWEVVNEAILDDGSWRPTKFYQIIGPEFVEYAFRFAHEADPAANLYYNDYNTYKPTKRQGIVDMVKNLQANGVKIDGIGMQGHVNLIFPTMEDFENSLLAFHGLGVDVMITELDITVLPWPTGPVTADVALNMAYNKELNPYAEGLPEDVALELHNRFMDFFNKFIEHQDKISRVTMWGTVDHHSWRNNWPVRGRTDYALLFDRNYAPKPVVQEIINAALAAREVQ